MQKGMDLNMKKNFIISILALMLAVSAAGCGAKTDKGSALVDGEAQTSSTMEPREDAPQTTSAPVEAPQGNEQEQLNNYGKDADKSVDMDKIKGNSLKSDKSGSKGDGKFSTCNVSIDEVKAANIDGSDVIIVQYDFKNTSGSDINFDGEVYAEAYQDGMELSPAIFQGAVDGFSTATLAQKVAPGESIKVQKAFATADVNTVVELYVRDTYDQTGQAYLAQVWR